MGGREGQRQKKITDESDDDDEKGYRWRWRGIPMMKRGTDDYDEEKVKETDKVRWKGEEGDDDEEEEWKVEQPMKFVLLSTAVTFLVSFMVIQVANWLMNDDNSDCLLFATSPGGQLDASFEEEA